MSEITRQDWDFEECLSNESFFCHGYEFAREFLYRNPDQMSDFRQWIEKNPRIVEDARWFVKAGFSTVPPVEIRQYLDEVSSPHLLRAAPWEFILSFDEFPEKPWLCIPKQKRGLVLWHFGCLIPELVKGVPENLRPEQATDLEKERQFLESYEAIDEYYGEDQLPFTGKRGQKSTAFFVVDFSYADKVIQAAFDAWLKHNRGDRRHFERRGKTGFHKKELKALGAARLLREKGNSKVASNFIFLEFGHTLYRSKTEWSKAKTTVANRLQSLAGLA